MSLRNPLTTIDRLAAYRKALVRWRKAWDDAVSNWSKDAVRRGEEPTPDSCKPEKCDPSDFGLTAQHQFLTDRIKAEVFK